MNRGTGAIRLVVFSDDWGRHPSSCQHLITQLLDRYPTIWVNTIGTRWPGISRDDLSKAVKKLRQWTTRSQRAAATIPSNLQVITPPMWPGFRRTWQRKLNARAISRAVNRALEPRADAAERRLAITTLPITADLIGRLNVDRWIYYSVDDFSLWPGLDGPVMQQMEQQQIHRVDAALAASESLQQHLQHHGRQASLLTHGIDLPHWASPAADRPLPPWCRQSEKPMVLFWGLIDRRLDTQWCQRLGELHARLVLVGPAQSPDPALAQMPHVLMPGPMSYDDLPALARQAAVLVMPYADLPVTRAMQPLKFKEYLATGKPVVARRLPATEPWAEAADLTENPNWFIELVRQRLTTGIPPEQKNARESLNSETWRVKARQFEQILLSTFEECPPT